MMFRTQCPHCCHWQMLPLHTAYDEFPVVCEKCGQTYTWKWAERICARLRVNRTCERFCTKAERFVCSARFRDGAVIPQPEKLLEQEEQEAARYVLRSGKYQGKTLEEVYAIDKSFLFRFLSPLASVSFQRKVEKALRYLERKNAL